MIEIPYVNITLQEKHVRAALVIAVVLVCVWMLVWYVFEYRPRVFVERAYPAWEQFEGAVQQARISNYEYDPYGTVDTNMAYVEEAAHQGYEILADLRGPNRELDELRERSLAVLDQYIEVASAFRQEFKEEADYYFALLSDLQDIFSRKDIFLPLATGITAANEDPYLVTRTSLELLEENIGILLTRTQLAPPPPDRLREYHVRLIELLRESHVLARQGLDEFSQFSAYIREGEGDDIRLAVQGAQVALRENGYLNGTSMAGAPNAGDYYDEAVQAVNGSSFSSIINNSRTSLLEQETQIQRTADYFVVISGLTNFYRTYEAFVPPELGDSDGGSLLAKSTGSSGTYAERWERLEYMIYDMEDIIDQMESLTPPDAFQQLHTETLAAFREAVAYNRAAQERFIEFNLDITDHRFITLATNIEELERMVTDDLDFAGIWGLRNVLDEQEDVSQELDAVSQGWRGAYQKYLVAN